MTRSYVELEIFRRRAKWSEEIVRKDKEFQDYAGADPKTASMMATIDVFLRYLNTNPTLALLVKLYRAYLIQRKKAYFCSTKANEITLLAFLKGKTYDTISAVSK